jgi:CHAT domain
MGRERGSDWQHSAHPGLSAGRSIILASREASGDAGMGPLVRGYDELRVRIERGRAGSYDVLASTAFAQASTTFALPFNELEIENFILRVSRPRSRRRIDTSAIGDARRFGGGLFKALFRDRIYDLYRDTLAGARGQGRGVRITLCLSGSPELIDVPWEYLFDDPDFLAVSVFTPVVRYLDLPREHRPPPAELPLRLLGVVSSPAEYEQLDVERERENLERALSGLTEAGAVKLHWLERPTLGALLKALQSQTFHALHYIGHGTYDRDAERGVLLFEDGGGWARPVSGDKLGMILHDFSSLRLAVLNACEGARTGRTDPFAGVAGSLVQRDIAAVVAMQFEISDEAAIVFAGGFYEGLATGSPVDASLAAARLGMFAERSDDIEWGTPVLFMRVSDGRIFDLRERREVSAARPAQDNGRGDRMARQTVRAAGIEPKAGRAHLGARGRLLAVGAVALVLVIIAVGAAALRPGGSSAVQKRFTANARPFTISYASPWRLVSTPVAGTFLRRVSAHSGTRSTPASDSQPVRLVAGNATLAAGELTTSAAVPGGAPPALLRRYGRPITSTDVQIAGHGGREYAWSLLDRRLVAYVLPTPTNDGAVICSAPTPAAATLKSCATLVEGAQAAAEKFLAPGPDRELALAIARPLRSVRTIRSIVQSLRGALPARAQATTNVSRTEARAAANLSEITSPPRYQHAVARLAVALDAEATAFGSLAAAARSRDRSAYSRAASRVTAASRALDATTRSLSSYELGVPTLAVLRLGGPPAIPKSTPVAPAPAQPSTTTGATTSSGSSSAASSPPASSPAPSARAPTPSGGTSGGGTPTYTTPFS